MQIPIALTLIALSIAACSPVVETADSSPPLINDIAAVSFNLSETDKSLIARKIWQNESGGSISGLTTWNAGEQFPSLGIGHFIWYPANYNGPFVESFPPFIKFAIRAGANPPAVARQRHSPWTSKAQFDADKNGTVMTGLRNWLAQNINVQADFIVAKSRAALPKILATAPAGDRARVRSNYDKVASTPGGIYALIDYVNFKGEGTNPSERYAGQGWGLAWVLQEMRDVPAGAPARREFAAAAKRCLDRRIANSPPARGEARWRAGWHNRCDTYARPLR